MKKNHQHITPPTMDEIINSINNEELRVDVINRLQNVDSLDDEIVGVKLFLESNHYDFKKLESFLNSSISSIDNVVKKNEKTPSYYWLKVAAVLVPLIGISFYFLLNKENRYDDLYSSYYQKELGLPVTLSNENDKVFNESMNLFRDEDYTTSLKGFQKLLLEQPNNDTLHYFIGVCLLENGKVSESVHEFNYNYQNSFFKEKVDYRLSLAYLKLKKLKESKSLLLVISKNPHHQYYNQSEELLKEDMFK